MSLIDRGLQIDKSPTAYSSGSLKATGLEVFERSLPMFLLRMFWRLSTSRLGLYHEVILNVLGR